MSKGILDHSKEMKVKENDVFKIHYMNSTPIHLDNNSLKVIKTELMTLVEKIINSLNHGYKINFKKEFIGQYTIEVIRNNGTIDQLKSVVPENHLTEKKIIEIIDFNINKFKKLDEREFKLGVDFTTFEIPSKLFIVDIKDKEKKNNYDSLDQLFGIYNKRIVQRVQCPIKKGGEYYEIVRLVTNNKDDYIERIPYNEFRSATEFVQDISKWNIDNKEK